MAIVQKLEESRIPRGSIIFYRNDQWVFQSGPTANEEHVLRSQPFDSLGPFGIQPVTISFEIIPATCQYTILSIGNQQLRTEERATGYYAPIAQITLEGSARSTANIPDHATHFCWLYPPNNVPSAEIIGANNEYEKNLLHIGGFAYFKLNATNSSALELIRVNALIASAKNGLTFEGPYPWRAEFTDRLWSENRFHPVTLPNLHEKGARYFAFINPYETFVTTNDRSSWTPSSNGAFAYLFNDDHSPHPFDCFFPVSDDCLGVAPSAEDV
ncbi:unnamed protein product [Adineta ricciae]|uniref:Uncharacterized protein n=1 Tax=Adineta ricciae TaxID=249248 RepID=A0A814LF03_ADIRI|nr:unnamed protein product [Adineta ricciae]